MDRINFPCEFKFAGDDAPGTVEGYASVFGALDQGGDMVMAGAFKSSIADWKKRGQLVPMLWQHDPDEPIGVWPELQEDDKGLRVKGELILDVPQAKAARALMRAGAVTGLSIGYQTKYAEVDQSTGARRLKKVDLWEISVVTFPMLPQAQAAVKNFDPGELEDALREEGKLSRRDAKTAIAILRKQLQRDAGASRAQNPREAVDVLMSLRKTAALLRG